MILLGICGTDRIEEKQSQPTISREGALQIIRRRAIIAGTFNLPGGEVLSVCSSKSLKSLLTVQGLRFYSFS
jgi:hypothetical protein